MDVLAALVAHLQAPEAIDPRQRACSTTNRYRPSLSLGSMPRPAIRAVMPLFLDASEGSAIIDAWPATLGFRWFPGKSGSITSHRASVKSCLAILSAYRLSRIVRRPKELAQENTFF
jgi:hypothetical protein